MPSSGEAAPVPCEAFLKSRERGHAHARILRVREPRARDCVARVLRLRGVMGTHTEAHHSRKRIATLEMKDVMTPQPITIGRDQTLETAHAMMRQHHCRHLPVLEHGELVGVISQRDLYFLESLAGVEMERDKVEDAMSQEAYAVTPDARVEEVCARMADEKLGCAVVIERNRVAGIFTATDALRILAGNRA
jgi:acetoin utilization protein AcuB